MDTDQLADDIIRLFKPLNVLHLGCENADLVTALLARNVPSFGISLNELDLNKYADIVADHIFVEDILTADNLWFPKYDLIVAYNFLENRTDSDLQKIEQFINEHGERFYAIVHTVKQGGEHRLEWYQSKFESAYFEEYH